MLLTHRPTIAQAYLKEVAAKKLIRMQAFNYPHSVFVTAISLFFKNIKT